MDFKLYARVLWRFRMLVVAGLLLAVTLAFLSIVKVTPMAWSTASDSCGRRNCGCW